MCDLDAVRDAAEKEAEARVLGDRGEALGYSVEEAFTDGAVWLAGKLPTRQELTAAIAAEFAEGDPQSAAETVLALIRTRVAGEG